MMTQVQAIASDFEDFRAQARKLLLEGVAPDEVVWRDSRFVDREQASFSMESLFGSENAFESRSNDDLLLREDVPTPFATRDVDTNERRSTISGSILNARSASRSSELRVPRAFLTLAQHVAQSSAGDKWALLFRLLWRLNFQNPKLLEIFTDDDVRRAHLLQKAVAREVHKIHAFVRFQEVMHGDEKRYVAWMEVEHPCLRLAAPLFQRRFGDRPWSIFTQMESAHWDLEKLTFAEGRSTPPPRGEVLDELWLSYYKSIFNPARVKIGAMKKEMPVRYWGALPEAEIIRDLIQEAPERLRKMARNQNTRAVPPPTLDLNELRKAASACEACPLFKGATQTVFGEGAPDARLMIIGEQPGDTEDTQGHPFIGPAGEVLAKQMALVGIERDSIYVTNAVKHFKWKPGPPGKPRLHQKASGAEMHACKPWLEREIDAVKPDVILALGVTAATSLMGRSIKISEVQGDVLTDLPWAKAVIVSYHPSAILRAMDASEGKRMTVALRESLAKAKALCGDDLD